MRVNFSRCHMCPKPKTHRVPLQGKLFEGLLDLVLVVQAKRRVIEEKTQIYFDSSSALPLQVFLSFLGRGQLLVRKKVTEYLGGISTKTQDLIEILRTHPPNVRNQVCSRKLTPQFCEMKAGGSQKGPKAGCSVPDLSPLPCRAKAHLSGRGDGGGFHPDAAISVRILLPSHGRVR